MNAIDLTAVSEAELRAGVAILPEGRRRERLAAEVGAVIEQDFAGRVLPFDSAAAWAYAAIATSRRSSPSPRSPVSHSFFSDLPQPGLLA